MSEVNAPEVNADVVKQLRDLIGEDVTKIVTDSVKQQVDLKMDEERAKAAPGVLINMNNKEVKRDKGIEFARQVICAAQSKGDPKRAIELATKAYGADDPVTKTLVSNVETSGGSFVPVNYDNDIIELLRPMSVIRSLGPRLLPLANGNMTIPKFTSGGAADYAAENSATNPGTMTTGLLRFISKKLKTIIPMTDEILRRSDPRIDALVRDDMLMAMAAREDLAFIRGDGTGDSPVGLLNLANASNKFDAGADDLAGITNSLRDMVLRLWVANIKMINPGWIFSPRTAMRLMTIRDGNGNYAFRDEMMTGRFWMWPYKVSTQIPENLGVGGNESEVYLVDFAEFVIADEATVEISQSNEATYVDGSGTTISCFQNDLVLIKALSYHDCNIRYDLAAVVLQAVTWGA